MQAKLITLTIVATTVLVHTALFWDLLRKWFPTPVIINDGL